MMCVTEPMHTQPMHTQPPFASCPLQAMGLCDILTILAWLSVTSSLILSVLQVRTPPCCVCCPLCDTHPCPFRTPLGPAQLLLSAQLTARVWLPLF